MSLDMLQEIIERAELLSTDEKLRLASYLVESARKSYARPATAKWQDLCGLAPDLLQGEDAQEWVSGARQEQDHLRATQWTTPG